MDVRMKAIGEPPPPNWMAVGVNWLAGFAFETKVIVQLACAAPAARKLGHRCLAESVTVAAADGAMPG